MSDSLPQDVTDAIAAASMPRRGRTNADAPDPQQLLPPTGSAPVAEELECRASESEPAPEPESETVVDSPAEPLAAKGYRVARWWMLRRTQWHEIWTGCKPAIQRRCHSLAVHLKRRTRNTRQHARILNDGLHRRAQDLAGHLEAWHERRHPRTWAGAFGKHPCASDHLTDLPGEAPPSMGAVATILYFGGIKRAVTEGEWEQAERDGVAVPFGHALVYRPARRPQHVVVGRMWASRDGVRPRPRTEFPMLAIAEMSDAHGAKVSDVLNVLKDFEQACRTTEDRQPVIAALANARSRLAELDALARASSTATDQATGDTLADGSPNPGVNGETSQADQALPEATLAQMGARMAMSRHLHIPLAAAVSPVLLEHYTTAIAAATNASDRSPRADLWIVAADEMPWLDVLLLEPGASLQVRFLRSPHHCTGHA